MCKFHADSRPRLESNLGTMPLLRLIRVLRLHTAKGMVVKGEAKTAAAPEARVALVCQKAGEISLMKQQMKDSQADVAQKLNEMVALRTQLKEATSALRAKEEQVLILKDSVNAKGIELEVCENELQRKTSEAQLLREKLGQNEAEICGLKQALAARVHQNWDSEESADKPREELACESDEAKMQRQNEDTVKALKKQIERLQGELRLERQQHEQQVAQFEEERQTWQDEKEKVIKYQKQLQLNYVEMQTWQTCQNWAKLPLSGFHGGRLLSPALATVAGGATLTGELLYQQHLELELRRMQNALYGTSLENPQEIRPKVYGECLL
eukprot:g44150.t1